MIRVQGACVVALCVAGPSAAQPLAALSHSAVFDPDLSTLHFVVDFDRPPDFYTLDPEGRPAHSFQIHLDTQPGNLGWGGTSPYPWETIVRGGEIHEEGDIRIRDHILGPSGTPGSGGWGPLAGSVPYDLVDRHLSFEAPYSMLNTTTGRFTYSLEVYEFGSWTGVTYAGASVVVPSPAPAVALGLFAGAMAVRRRRGSPG